MLDILGITGPIYITILFGYLATRHGLFAKADMQVFGKFVINLALPAMLFNALAQRRLGEIVNLSYMLAYTVGSLAVILLALLWARRVSGHTPIASAFYAMGMSCSNSGFVGYPILLLTFAPVAGVALALNMVVENLLVIPVTLALADRAQGDAGPLRRLVWQTLKRLASNPMILGLLAGFVASVLEWSPPGPVTRTVNLFASACGVLSLFVIGGTLVGLPAQGMARQITPIVVGKLILHPALVALAFWALPGLGFVPVEPVLRTAAIVLAAMPMMGIYPILALKYGQEGFSASALLAATTLSFLTVSGLLWLVK